MSPRLQRMDPDPTRGVPVAKPNVTMAFTNILKFSIYLVADYELAK